jgi:hypothetical protein
LQCAPVLSLDAKCASKATAQRWRFDEFRRATYLALRPDEIHGASAFRKASRWEPHTAGSEWVPWPRVSSLVGIST